jgi:predicted oxidoreductase
MVFGHNSNIKFGAHTFHVQTEDRGESHALIDTTVYYQGRVLHRRTNNYLDLLPLNEDSQQALKMRVDEQHRTVLEEIRNGELALAVPAAAEPKPAERVEKPVTAPAKADSAAGPEAKERKFSLELLNARNWLVGKQATLHVAVQEAGGKPAEGVKVCAEIEGSATPAVHSSRTGSMGRATISFDMPKLAGGDVALVIRMDGGGVCPPLRYALRAKPRVPAV